MRATREVGEVPCAAEYGGTYDEVAVGKSHVSCGGWVHTMRALTSEWPDEMDDKSQRIALFFFFFERMACVPQRPTSSS